MKRCPVCGREFSCNQQTGRACWCESYLLQPDVLADLRKKYSDCLCPECLPGYAENLNEFTGKKLIIS